ncbi:MAG: hypothetical protein K2X66_02470 [Cyanobacteria bacterium]|nr:hypothetical protein [Cyanobacteriota bacterium]
MHHPFYTVALVFILFWNAQISMAHPLPLTIYIQDPSQTQRLEAEIPKYQIHPYNPFPVSLEPVHLEQNKIQLEERETLPESLKSLRLLLNKLSPTYTPTLEDYRLEK